LLFQPLDNKKECYKIYCEGQFFDDYKDDNFSHTWTPSSHVPSAHIEYAQIYCHGKSLAEVCPEHLKPRFDAVNKKGKVYLQTFHSSKINLDDVCFYDLVPEKFLLDFCQVKNEITRHVFENYEKPKNYEFLKNLLLFLNKIGERKINLDLSSVDLKNTDAKSGIEKLRDCSHNVVYNPWKTVTGRLTTEKNSFPILTLNKDLRHCIKPQNDLFLELDFNAAELRTLLGLLGEKQPEQDMHAWLSENVFDNKFDRDQTKKKVFSWLYNPNSKNKKLNEYLDREKIQQKYYNKGEVHTPFGRDIVAPEDKAVNYLIQSTSNDISLTSAMNVDKLLRNTRSFLSFCIHDSIVVDISAEDKGLVDLLKDEFSKTIFGDLKVNMSLGKNFGEMRKIS
jgi:hypothetical protein|tara:strand:+ start:3814 stop:4992 length:1179 start_codon:yes stop_codon:yes gene_type:complete